MLWLDLTSLYIRSGFFDHPSSQVSAEVVWSKSHDHLDYQDMDCSATRILSSSVMVHHPQVALLVEWNLTFLQNCSEHTLQPQPTVITLLFERVAFFFLFFLIELNCWKKNKYFFYPSKILFEMDHTLSLDPFQCHIQDATERMNNI